MMREIIIYSSDGELRVGPEDGIVDNVRSDYYGTDELKTIDRFDIEEFCMFWGCEPQSGDILDFGYWEGERYEAPVMEWRLDTVIPMLLEEAAQVGTLDKVGNATTPGELLRLIARGFAFGSVPKEPRAPEAR